MFLSGTFGLSEGVALYPTEDVKGELWSLYRRVTDLPVQVDAIHEALRAVANTFFTVVDPAPSSAGTALTIAVDPTLVTYDMVRTAMHLYLERAGVPSAALSTTLDQIQRHQAKIRERGGNVTRLEFTFFVPAAGYTLSPLGVIRTEGAGEAEARAERAAEEVTRTEREIKAAEKLERIAELEERHLKDEVIVGAKTELAERVAELEAKRAEIEALQARVVELEAEQARQAAAKAEAEAAIRELETERARQATAQAEAEATLQREREAEARAAEAAREARQASVERGQAGLEARAPERIGVTGAEIEGALEREEIRQVAEREEIREAAGIPVLPAEIAALPPEARAVRLVPVLAPPAPKRIPWNKKVQDARGRWRDQRGRYVSPPKWWRPGAPPATVAPASPVPALLAVPSLPAELAALTPEARAAHVVPVTPPAGARHRAPKGTSRRKSRAPKRR